MVPILVNRLLQSIVVMLLASIIAFLLFRFVGDPVNQMVGMDTAQVDREALRRDLGLDDPALVQFLRFVVDAARLDFGSSYQFKTPVASLILERLPATVELATTSLVLALSIGIPIGVYVATHPGSPVSGLFMAFALIGVSLPTFLIGVLLVFVFSVQLGVLPSFGRGEVVQIGAWSTGLVTLSGLKAIVLPAATLALFQLGLIVRLVRAEMVALLGSDVIRFARARGLSARTVYYGHGLRNILVPVVTVVGLQFGSIVAFAIVTETVFQWPGLGLMFLSAVQNADIPVMSAYLLLVSLVFVVINAVVDVLYLIIDPRLRLRRTTG